MYVQGYLLSSTVDFLAVDSWSLSYIWLLMVVGWFLPNLLILSSHVIVILTYRSAQTSTNLQRAQLVDYFNLIPDVVSRSLLSRWGT